MKIFPARDLSLIESIIKNVPYGNRKCNTKPASESAVDTAGVG